MLTEQTIDIMRSLRLTGMLEALEEQYKMPKINDLSFHERLGLLIDAERCHRENKRLLRFHKVAKFRYSQACIEDLDYSPRRKLSYKSVSQHSQYSPNIRHRSDFRGGRRIWTSG